MAQKEDSQRYYIFKDGAYQDWLNGRAFAIGGYKTNRGSASGYPQSDLSITDNNIIMHLLGTANRINSVCIGIQIGDLLPKRIKRIGGKFKRTVPWQNADHGAEIGVSTIFATSQSSMSSALGEYNDFPISPISTTDFVKFETDVTLQTPEYVFALLRVKNADNRYIYISEVWVEV